MADAGFWPCRLAVLLLGTTIVTIWVGSLVTTSDAGMAAPEWPHRWGLELVGWTEGLRGRASWDLFVDAAHRLLGVLVGVLALALSVTVWWSDRRRWMRWLVLAALLALVAEIVLGVTRVLCAARQLAMLHAVTGMMLLSLGVVIAVCTTRRWCRRRPATGSIRTGGLLRLAMLTTLFAAVQMVLGSLLRHVPVDAEPGTFRALAALHLGVAAMLLIHVLAVCAHLVRRYRHNRVLRWAAFCLLAVTGLQILLGGGTWIVSFAWPIWLHGWKPAAAYTIPALGILPTQVVSAHVTNGALVLAVVVWILLESLRESAVCGTRPVAYEKGS